MSETEGTEMDEQGQEAPSSPPEPEMPQAGREVAPEEPASLPLPGLEPEPYEPPAPPEPAEPGIYLCDDPDPGIHPVLGRLVTGENDFTGMTHPDSLLAIAALVEEGVLKKADA